MALAAPTVAPPTCPQLSDLPLLQTLELIREPLAFFDKYQQRHGDLFAARVLGIGSPPVVFGAEPEFLEAIFNATSEKFELGQIVHVFRPFAGDLSLIMLTGAAHQRQRKLLMPPLHGDRLRGYGETICQLTTEAIAALPAGKPFEMRACLETITLQVILQVVFGIAPGQRATQLQGAIARVLDLINQPLFSALFFFPTLQQDWGRWSPWGYYQRLQGEIDRAIYAEIAARRAALAGNSDDCPGRDVLSLLLAAQDEAGQSMSDRELRDQLVTLLFLGHDTTASALSWAFYWLHARPETLKQLRSELATLGPEPEVRAIAALPYLQAVCQETLRVNPIALISQPRVVRASVEIAGHVYAPGTILVPSIYMAHRREAVFPAAAEFQPQRFCDRKFSALEYFPFGGGSRICIGSAFALYQMKLVLATALIDSRFSFAP
ncbi:MAG: cytochrome P450, partial [Cyanobacteria bacterium J06641_5]